MGFATEKGFGPGAGKTLLEALYGVDIHIFDDFTHWAESVVGSGSTSRIITHAAAITGSTANSSAIVETDVYLRCEAGGTIAEINWGKAIEIVFFGNFSLPGVVGTRYSFMRLCGGTTFGNMAAQGVGFLFNRNGGVLIAESNDGSLVEQSSLGAILDTETIQRFRIKVVPGSSVLFYVNEVLRATHTTRVPSGTQASIIRLGAKAGAFDNLGSRADLTRVILQAALGG